MKPLTRYGGELVLVSDTSLRIPLSATTVVVVLFCRLWAQEGLRRVAREGVRGLAQGRPTARRIRQAQTTARASPA